MFQYYINVHYNVLLFTYLRILLYKHTYIQKVHTHTELVMATMHWNFWALLPLQIITTNYYGALLLPPSVRSLVAIRPLPAINPGNPRPPTQPIYIGRQGININPTTHFLPRKFAKQWEVCFFEFDRIDIHSITSFRIWTTAHIYKQNLIKLFEQDLGSVWVQWKVPREKILGSWWDWDVELAKISKSEIASERRRPHSLGSRRCQEGAPWNFWTRSHPGKSGRGGQLGSKEWKWGGNMRPRSDYYRRFGIPWDQRGPLGLSRSWWRPHLEPSHHDEVHQPSTLSN